MLPRICMVSDHGCIRVLKESLALQEKGYQVDHVANNYSSYGRNVFDTFSIWEDAEQLKRTVMASKADIFHVHNEPDWLVNSVREATDRPIVFDVHDLESLRWNGEANEIENQAFQNANAFIHVSEPCRAAAEKIHGGDKPTIVLPSFVNERFMQIPPCADPCFSTIVYEGGLDIRQGEIGEHNGMKMISMRNLVPVVAAFINQGFTFHLFSASQLDDYTYENLGAFVSKQAPYTTMLSGIRPAGYGFVGASVPIPLMNAAMPNKLFEYMSQGVVPVVFNADEAAKFVKENELGIVIDDLDNLKDKLWDVIRIRENVLNRRMEFTMENQIQKLMDLYKTLK